MRGFAKGGFWLIVAHQGSEDETEIRAARDGDEQEVTSPTIDTSTAGEHTITYRVIDANDAVLAEAIRTVIVQDPNAYHLVDETAATTDSLTPEQPLATTTPELTTPANDNEPPDITLVTSSTTTADTTIPLGSDPPLTAQSTTTQIIDEAPAPEPQPLLPEEDPVLDIAA